MKLDKIEISGFKSISSDEPQHISFGAVTVLLGANGSGKSNLVSFFDMLNYLIVGELHRYIGHYGTNDTLFYGAKKTKNISFTLYCSTEEEKYAYHVTLSYATADKLYINGEKLIIDNQKTDDYYEHPLVATSNNLALLDEANIRQFPGITNILLRRRNYNFHDTSETAGIKLRSYIDDTKRLYSDGRNLAAFLKMLKENEQYRKYYKRIVEHIKWVMPQFGDFSLEVLGENKDYTRLNWVDNSGNDYLFSPAQISDGTLRFMALATLLLQPPDLLPKFIVIDEPELGLHPSAIADLAGMINIAAQNSQVLIATQSMRLVDEFSADQLLITERDNEKRCSVFKRLDEQKLAEWLERYCLSELWEKNVLGGKP